MKFSSFNSEFDIVRDRELLINTLRETVTHEVCYKKTPRNRFWISCWPNYTIEYTLAISAIREEIIIPSNMTIKEFKVQLALGTLNDTIIHFFKLAKKYRQGKKVNDY